MFAQEDVVRLLVPPSPISSVEPDTTEHTAMEQAQSLTPQSLLTSWTTGYADELCPTENQQALMEGHSLN